LAYLCLLELGIWNLVLGILDMPDRSIAPPLQQITNLKFIQPVVHQLDNGIPVHEINLGTQDVIKLEIIFIAGRWTEQNRLAARATGAILKEGISGKNSAQIAEFVDFYGATLSTASGLDTAGLTLYCMTRHLEQLLPIVREILTDPIFPQKEIDTFVERRSRQLRIEAEKVDVVAYRELTAALYGNDHPYGYNSTPEMYRQIEREHLVEHFQTNYHAGNSQIILAGKTAKDSVDLLNRYLGDIPAKQNAEPQYIIAPYEFRKLCYDVPNTLQTGIRTGRRWVSRHHADYAGLFVLNTLLGGYFGSRLMKNIREDKGYTYGIFSTVDVMLNDCYFYIGTEVGAELTEATLSEIHKELKILQTKSVEKEELERLRNYMLGNLLATLDGPFNVAQVTRALILEGLDESFFDRIVHTIQHIQPDKLQELAQQYLNVEDFHEVIVG